MRPMPDLAIIGGGIVGLATALAVRERFPKADLAILEKEARVAVHQTGHNSGVIHSGIYYKPGSHKARLCVEGARAMTAFCDAHGIPYERCGKVIVATSEAEVGRLHTLYERGTENGVPGLRMIEADELKTIEPQARAIRAIHSPNTAIVDFAAVAQAMAAALQRAGVRILTDHRVTAVSRTGGTIRLDTAGGMIEARHVINCGGLHSDAIARLMDASPDVTIVPFRGEYYMLRPESRHLVRGLIYPVPDPEFPFLGVHFTRTIHGEVEAGPNAVLAFAREGYSFGRVHARELASILGYRGFWAMVARYWRTGSYEMYRSLSKPAFVRALQQLVPAITGADVSPGGAGVRAQAVAADGSLVDDFRILVGDGAIHVLNAPSPAATASLAIGQHIAGLVEKSFALS
jgi:(S)-2-hydroxyglutarate dehydrogenase